MLKIIMIGLFSLCPYLVNAGGIVATVNDTPISTFDLENRINLLKLQNPKIKNEPNIAKIALEDLIDEQIKLQTMEKHKIKVKKEDINNAVAFFEKQYNLNKGGIKDFLSAHNSSLTLFRQRISADLGWMQYLKENGVMPSEVSSASVEEQYAKIKKEIQQKAYFLAQVDIKEEKEAQKVFEEIKNKKISFEDAMQKYSVNEQKQAGWIKESALNKNVAEILNQVNAGQLSTPIKNNNVYSIFWIQEIKPQGQDSILTWDMAQMAVRLNTLPTQVIEQIQTTKSCDRFMLFAQKYGIPDSVQRGQVNPEQLSQEFQLKMLAEPLNTVIGPFDVEGADLFLMRCGENQESLLPSKNQIKIQLESILYENLLAKELKKVRSGAVVEYK